MRDRNRIDEAEEYYDLALKQAYEKGNLKYITWIMNNQATLFFDKGDFNRALIIGDEGYALSKKIGDYRQAGVFENLLANICFINGQIENAIQYCKTSIHRDKVLGNEPDSSVNWLLLGECYFEINDYSEARRCYDQSLRCFDDSSDKDFLMNCASRDYFCSRQLVHRRKHGGNVTKWRVTLLTRGKLYFMRWQRGF